jgi:DNA-binding NarL/FixJ family response regulator
MTECSRHITILCVDDHHLVRAGLVRVLALQEDMRVVADVGSGAEAVREYRKHRPDVTLLDLQMPGMSGFATLEAIRDVDADARVVVVTMSEGDQDIHRALQVGAVGYLLKDSVPEELVRVIREVVEGRMAIPASVRERVEAYARQPTLSAREIQVIELLGLGMRNKEIGAALGITEETTRVHVKSIYLKFNVHDRTAALAEAVRRGFVHI